MCDILSMLSCDEYMRACGSFRDVPCAVHGASQSTQSKHSVMCFPNHCPGFLLTIVFVTPARCSAVLSVHNLFSCTSLAMMCPVLCIRAAICVVLLPGAALISKMISPCFGSKSSAGNMLAASCIYIHPVRCMYM